MDTEVRILHTDDDSEFSAMVVEYLESLDDRFSVETSSAVKDSLAILDAQSFDCIVSDYDMPGRDGIDFLQTVRRDHPKVPFILFTGKGSEAIASEAISFGVTDYLQKGGPETYELLANRIDNYVEQNRMHRIRKRQLDAIETTTEGISILTESGTFIFVNQAYADLYGYTPDEMVGMHWREIYPEDEIGRIAESVLPAVRETGYWHGETVGLRSDGTTFIEDHTLAITAEGEIVCTVRDITDRQQQYHRVMGILDSIEATVWVRDAQSRYQLINDAYRDELELGSTDIIGKTPTEILDAELGQRFIEADQRVLETGEPYEMERTVTRKPTELIKLIRLTPVFDHTGEVSAICGVSTDITEQKAQERAAQRRAERLALALEAGDIAVWEWDIDNDHMAFDDRFETILGYEPGELRSDPGVWIDLRHPDDNDRVLAAVNALREGSVSSFEVEQRVQSRSGDWLWIHDIGRIVEWDESGDPVRAVGCIHDITERKEREMALEEQKQTVEALLDRFEHVLDGTETVVWEYTSEPPSFEFFGPTDALIDLEREAIDSTEAFISEIADPDDHDRLAGLFQLLQSGDQTEFAIEFQTPAGHSAVTWLRAHAAVVDSDPLGVRIVGLLTDISDRKERELRLEQFAGIVSHDLRNPLNVIAGRLELVAEDCESEHLDPVHDSLDRMHRLIEDLLTWTREGESVDSVTPQPLAAVSQVCWNSVKPEEATLTIEADCTIHADRARFYRLLENVFRNAVEHGGDTVRIGPLPNGFYIEDSGSGIPKELGDSVFETGFSTSPKGTGFGLAIISQIAAAHDWDLTVTTGNDGGARFEFTDVAVTD